MKRGTASGISTDQFAEFAAAVTRSLPRDLDPTFVQMLIERNGRLREFLSYGLKKGPEKKDLYLLKGRYATPVDYEMSLERAALLKKFDQVDALDLIPKNFPPNRKGKALVEIQIIDLNLYENIGNFQPTIEAVREGLDQMGLRPADVRELISLGMQGFDFQEEIWINTILSLWTNYSCILALVVAAGRNELRIIHAHNFGGSLRYYVAAVSKDSGVLNLPEFLWKS